MLPFRSGHARSGPVFLSIFLVVIFVCAAFAAEKKGGKKKVQASAAASATEDFGNVPLPVGHEAKGLVLPDFDLDGHMRGKFVAGVAKRLDDVHMQLRDLIMTTFTPESKPDLEIVTSDSVLDLKTRVLNSTQRTTVKRTDFTIVGDTMQFDTVSRQGTLVGNVKMVILDSAHLMEEKPE
ncbi:MAG: hypothetical protein QOI04_2204 [Verrucomicrobiota bacterium]|jgi:hypothetical protein